MSSWRHLEIYALLVPDTIYAVGTGYHIIALQQGCIMQCIGMRFYEISMHDAYIACLFGLVFDSG